MFEATDKQVRGLSSALRISAVGLLYQGHCSDLDFPTILEYAKK